MGLGESRDGAGGTGTGLETHRMKLVRKLTENAALERS